MKNILIFILLPILLTVVGEFLLKFGTADLSVADGLVSVSAIIFNGNIVFGVGLIVISALLWIVGMSKFQLSFMYPFLSLNYVMIIVGAEIILKEDVQFNRYVSILLIIIGLVFIF